MIVEVVAIVTKTLLEWRRELVKALRSALQQPWLELLSPSLAQVAQPQCPTHTSAQSDLMTINDLLLLQAVHVKGAVMHPSFAERMHIF